MIACAGLIGYQPLTMAEDVRPESDTVNNSVTVDDETYNVNDDVSTHDGALDNVYGGGSEGSTSDVAYNQVSITGGVVENVIGGVSSAGNVENNTVVIDGGEITNAVGGLTVVNGTVNESAGDVTGNRIIIHGGTIKFVSGGEIGYVYPLDDGLIDALGRGTVADNVVEISGGKIDGNVIGGAALKGSALNNSIEITGGAFNGSIIGGLVEDPSEESQVTGNSITIRLDEDNNPNAAFDEIDAYLIGGMVGDGEGGYSYRAAGNTLNIGAIGVKAKNIYGFENINFDLPSSATKDVTVLTLTEGATDLAGTHLSINTHGDAQLDTNDQFKLIVNDNGLNFADGETARSYALDGDNTLVGSIDDMTYSRVMNRGSVGYELDLVPSEDGTTFLATVGEVIPQAGVIDPPVPQPKDYKDFFSSMAEDFEHVHDQRGFEIFFNTGGGRLKTKTGGGNYMTTTMGSYDLGIARHFKGDSHVLSFAPVFEYGHSKYDVTFQSRYLGRARGEGHQQYAAGGVVVRNFNAGGFYYEGSLRAGRTNTTYATHDFVNVEVHNADVYYHRKYMKYHAESPVVMGHVRVGNQFRLGRNHVLDLYGIYSYTRLGSSNADLNLGNHYHFSSTDSGRLKVGYRLTSRLNPISQLYTGLAYQYDTTSDSTSEERGIENSDARELRTKGKDGSSGMIELGWLMRPLNDSPWTIDLNATGWFGMQKGVSAMAKLKKAF